MLFALGLVFGYFWFVSEPTMPQTFHDRAFALSGDALKNSVYLAHTKFLSQTDLNQKSNLHTDVWMQGDIGLDFNQYGFPIGTSRLKWDSTAPVSSASCQEIWNFFMAPLQPIVMTPQRGTYWTHADHEGRCYYRSTFVNQLQITYDPTAGTVEMSDVNR